MLFSSLSVKPLLELRARLRPPPLFFWRLNWSACQLLPWQLHVPRCLALNKQVWRLRLQFCLISQSLIQNKTTDLIQLHNLDWRRKNKQTRCLWSWKDGRSRNDGGTDRQLDFMTISSFHHSTALLVYTAGYKSHLDWAELLPFVKTLIF